jgi:hypothetical protein
VGTNETVGETDGVFDGESELATSVGIILGADDGSVDG